MHESVAEAERTTTLGNVKPSTGRNIRPCR